MRHHPDPLDAAIRAVAFNQPIANQQFARFRRGGCIGLSEFDLIESRVGCLTDAVYLPGRIGRRDLGTMEIL